MAGWVVGNCDFNENPVVHLDLDFDLGFVISEVRRAIVQYKNSNEEGIRTSDRAARSIIKLFNVDDQNWQADMEEVNKLLEVLKVSNITVSVITCDRKKFQEDDVVMIGKKLDLWLAKKRVCKVCCCSSHCGLTDHDAVSSSSRFDVEQVSYPMLLDRSWMDTEDYMYSIVPEPSITDPFLSLICAVDTDLSLGETNLIGLVPEELSC